MYIFVVESKICLNFAHKMPRGEVRTQPACKSRALPSCSSRRHDARHSCSYPKCRCLPESLNRYESPDCNSDLVSDEVGKPMPNSIHEACEIDFMREQRLVANPHSRCCACAWRNVGWRHDTPSICHDAQRLEDDWDFS